MSKFAVVLMYPGMLIFDAGVLAGTVYLIGWQHWSAWWMLLAVLMVAGSNPRFIIAAAQSPQQESE